MKLKYPHRCNICDKSFKNEHGLKIHHFRKHVIKKKKNKKGRPLGSKNGKAENESRIISWCPCCGTDLRKIAIALSL